MRRKLRGVTLIDLVALTGIVTTVLSLSFVSTARLRELSRRLVCSVNLQGIGAVAQIYAQDHDGQWMVPPFKAGAIDQHGIDYLNDGDTSSDLWPNLNDEGEVGWDRIRPTYSETPQSQGQGSEVASVTRAYWMLVRSGDVHVQQFICPSSLDVADESELTDLYYDFTGYQRISYGYQVPFGPRDTRPRAGADLRRIQAADKGPFYRNMGTPPWNQYGNNPPVTLNDQPSEWRAFNSTNHGGLYNGEGQNCLYPDGSVCFHAIPAVGVDNDNIYTLMSIDWGDSIGTNRIHGETPHESATVGPPYPGQDAFGSGPNRFSSTDTLLYP